jgi:hypothetical protein
MLQKYDEVGLLLETVQGLFGKVLLLPLPTTTV